MAKMNFSFQVYKTANLFHFVSALTEWHFSAEKYYVDYWLKHTGPLTKLEASALDKFKNVLLKHNFGDGYLGKPLLSYPDNKAMLEACKLLTKKEYGILTNTFEILKPRFERVWKAEGPNLREWQTQLSKEGSASEIISKDLSAFFGGKPKKVTKVILLIGADVRGGGGGANSMPGCIEKEVGLNTKSTADIMPVIWHEYIHEAYREPARQAVKEYLAKNRIEKEILKLGLGGDPVHFLNEGLCYSLMPGGYLANKYGYYKRHYLTKNNKKILTTSPRNAYTALKYLSVINYSFYKDYIENKKVLDQKYLAKIHEGFRRYVEFTADVNKK